MKLTKFFKLFLVLSLSIVVMILSCQNPGSSSSGGGGGSGSKDDDDVKKELANGVYAKLIVARMTTETSGITVKMDSIEAIFSGYYDPCANVSDLHPTSVSCSDENGTIYNLIYTNDLYLYNEPMNINGFLGLGLEHEFDVVGSSEVPSLTESIDLPAAEPTIITPASNAIIHKSNDLNVIWHGTSGRNVSIVLISISNPSEMIPVETSDDGSYTFTSSQLSSLNNGQYYLHIERFDEHFINESGYDNRSIIRARLLYSILINLTD